MKDIPFSILTYMAFLLLFAVPLEWNIIRMGSINADGRALVYALMWAPAAAALLTQLLFHRSLAGLGWRIGPWKYTLVAYLIPPAAAVVVYGLVWITGIGEFNPSAFLPQDWPTALLAVASIQLLFTAIFAFGEELGWRGFLAPALGKYFDFGQVVLISGIVWALYHYPLLIWADYNASTPIPYAILMFTVSIFSVTVIATWLRIRSNSVWPAVMLHASHNIFIQGFFDKTTRIGAKTEYLTTEFGAGLAIMYALIAGYIWVDIRKRRNHPDWPSQTK